MKTIYKRKKIKRKELKERKKRPCFTLWDREPPRMPLSSFLLGIYFWASSLLLTVVCTSARLPWRKLDFYLQVVINWGQFLSSWWAHVSTSPSNSSIPSVTDCASCFSLHKFVSHRLCCVFKVLHLLWNLHYFSLLLHGVSWDLSGRDFVEKSQLGLNVQGLSLSAYHLAVWLCTCSQGLIVSEQDRDLCL